MDDCDFTEFEKKKENESTTKHLCQSPQKGRLT